METQEQIKEKIDNNNTYVSVGNKVMWARCILRKYKIAGILLSTVNQYC